LLFTVLCFVQELTAGNNLKKIVVMVFFQN